MIHTHLPYLVAGTWYLKSCELSKIRCPIKIKIKKRFLSTEKFEVQLESNKLCFIKNHFLEAKNLWHQLATNPNALKKGLMCPLNSFPSRNMEENNLLTKFQYEVYEGNSIKFSWDNFPVKIELSHRKNTSIYELLVWSCCQIVFRKMFTFCFMLSIIFEKLPWCGSRGFPGKYSFFKSLSLVFCCRCNKSTS